VTEAGLLGAAADLVERRVGEADHMEVIHDQPGGGQALGDGGGVGLVGVDDHMADPGQPRRWRGRQPVGDSGSAASRQNIDQTTLVEVDDPGHQQRRALGGGGEERGLIQPDRSWGTEAGEVIDSGSTVVARCGPSPHARTPEVPGGLGDRVLCRADPVGDLSPGALGEHRPRGDLVGLFGPRARRAPRLRAAPQALGPHQHHRPIRQRQVTDHHPAPAMAPRSHTTGRAPRPVLGGLHRQPPLAARVVEQLGAHHEPVEPDQRGHAATVAFHQGPPVDVAVEQPHQ
jgi:hypothetical protein